MRSTRLYDSDSESIIIRVHQPLQPLTHQTVIENFIAFVRQRLFLLSCYVRTKEPLTSIIVHASDYLLPTNVVSCLRSLWIIPLLCMNFKALAMPFAHPITFLAAAEVVVERPRTLSWFRKMCFIKFSLQSSMTRIGHDSPFSLRSVVPYILTIKGWFSFLKKAQ